MPYSFNPFSGNFDNTPSTVKGDTAYSNLASNSATWIDAYDTGTVYKANSASYATIDFANSKFFPLSGGTITGNTRINGNVTIFGDLTSTGTQTFANTVFTTTSSLSITHIGVGPALWVGNNGSGDIASFNDIDQGLEVLHIGGVNSTFPNVGVKVSNPNKDFTVKGELSASNTIWDSNGNSNQWNSAYSTVNSNSATTWNYQGTDLKNLSSGWVGGNSAYTSVNSNSANWNSVYSNVNANSATTWNYQGTDLKGLSSGWVGGNSAYTNLISNSAAYLSSVDLSFLSVSSDWNSVYSNVNANSATTWNYQGTDLKTLSGGWVGGNSAYTNLVSNSAAYLSAVDLSFLSVSGNWDSVYSNVNSNSANWNYQGTDLKDLSANWQNTYTNFSNNSASYATSSFVQNNFLPLSGGSVNGMLEAGSGSTITLFVSANKVGINTENPTEALTVAGNISSINFVYSRDGNSNQWNSAYTNLISNSAAYLSAVDLSFLSVSSDWDSVYSNVNSNSATTWNYQGTDLKLLSSGWVDGNSAYTNLVSNSAAYLSAVDLSFLSVSGNWDSVYSNVNSNSASYATISFSDSKYFPLTGGTITGNTRVNADLTVYGSISATGNSYFANTVYSTTSALSVINIGNSGPALFVGNNGSGDIASFYDIDQGLEVLHVGGNNGSFPNVGIKTSAPNKDFTVKGELSASSTIWDSNGNSVQWNSAYTTVNSNSATTWNYQGTDLKNLSSGWVGGNSAYTNLVSNSAAYLSAVDLSFLSVSADWQNTYTTVQSKSATEWDNTLANNYTRSNFLPLSGGTISGSLSSAGVISASASNIKINVVTDSTNRTFTDADNNKVVHIDTTTTPLCAIFPSSLSNGFNVAIMNIGTNGLVLSAASLKSAGTIIITQYGGAFVYKDLGNLFAVGRLV